MPQLYTHKLTGNDGVSVHCFTVNSFYQNTYVLSTLGGEGMLIDAGFTTNREWQELSDVIADGKITIKAILLTHSHIDHVLGLAKAQQTFSCPIHQHPDDAQNLRSAVLFAQAYGMPPLSLPDFSTIQPLTESQDFGLDGIDIRPLFTPGHCQGHLSFYLPDTAICFTGDALFHHSIGRTDLPGGNYNQLITSIKSKLLTLPSETIIYPGHMDPSTIGSEKQNNPFLQQ